MCPTLHVSGLWVMAPHAADVCLCPTPLLSVDKVISTEEAIRRPGNKSNHSLKQSIYGTFRHIQIEQQLCTYIPLHNLRTKESRKKYSLKVTATTHDPVFITAANQSLTQISQSRSTKSQTVVVVQTARPTSQPANRPKA